MTEPAHDVQRDPEIDAVAGLLGGVIRLKFGDDGLDRDGVFKYPIIRGVTPVHRYPAISIYRKTDRVDETSDSGEEFGGLMLAVDYYLPPTPPDRIAARWPMLRTVFKLVVQALRAGYHPQVGTGEPAFDEIGLSENSKTGGTVTYALEPDDAGLVPCFKAALSLRVSSFFDWTDYAGPDLAGIDTDANVDGREAPVNGVPAPDFKVVDDFSLP